MHSFNNQFLIASVILIGVIGLFFILASVTNKVYMIILFLLAFRVIFPITSESLGQF